MISKNSCNLYQENVSSPILKTKKSTGLKVVFDSLLSFMRNHRLIFNVTNGIMHYRDFDMDTNELTEFLNILRSVFKELKNNGGLEGFDDTEHFQFLKVFVNISISIDYSGMAFTR